MDKLEKFVRENRAEFDTKVPKDFVWESIEARLHQQAEPKGTAKVVTLRSRIYQYAKIAAIGLVLLTVGGFLGSYWTAQNQAEQLSFGTINEEYQELETFYAEQVSNQMTQLKKYRIDRSLMDDIEELDASFLELEKELNADGNGVKSEVVVNAMIENYQSKIAILERVLNRLERKNQEEQSVKNNNNEKVNL
jgi:hypothetical protein